MQDLLEPLFDEVQSSNMSKVCATKEDAERTASNYFRVQNIPCSHEQVGDVWIVKRNEDGKVLKSDKFFKPDLHGVVADYFAKSVQLTDAVEDDRDETLTLLNIAVKQNQLDQYQLRNLLDRNYISFKEYIKAVMNIPS